MHKEISDEELKKICLQILKRFDSICRENNLKYSITYGTLIGAIRHKGFIPWDDDIDVMMPREDYEKLLKLKYDDGEYEIRNYRYTKNYYYIFTKMIDKNTYIDEYNRREKNMGIYIDIFPVDLINDDEKHLREKIKKNFKYKKIVDIIGNKTIKKKSECSIKFIAKKIIKTLLTPLKKLIFKYIESNVMSNEGKYCKQLIYTSTTTDYFPVEFWDNIIEVNFENIKVKAFGDYDVYLRRGYGDYMNLPPKEEQVTHHNFKAYKK